MLSLGTYGGQLFGWKLRDDRSSSASSSSSAAPSLAYAFEAAEAPIRAAASSGRILAASSEDDILVFDVQARKQVGSLVLHTDTVTALAFAGPSALLSGSRDGTIAMWDAQKWTPMLSVRAHK